MAAVGAVSLAVVVPAPDTGEELGGVVVLINLQREKQGLYNVSKDINI